MYDFMSYSNCFIRKIVEFFPQKACQGQLRYRIYIESLFSSLLLFKNLQNLETGCAGTTRPTAKGFPKELNVGGGEDKRREWDTVGSFAVDNFNLCVGRIMLKFFYLLIFIKLEPNAV